MPSNAKSNRRPTEATMIRGSNVKIGYAKMNMTNHHDQVVSAERRYGVYILPEKWLFLY